MTKFCLTLFSFLFLLGRAGFAADTANLFRFVIPTKFDTSAQLTISGKVRDCYLLEGSSQVTIKVQGPSQLKVLSRIVMVKPADKPHYHFQARRDGTTDTYTFSHDSKLTDKASSADSAYVNLAEDRSRVITVPRGQQSFTFYLPKSSKDRIFLRFAVKSNEVAKNKPAVTMTPVEFSAKVDLVSREKSHSYYRIGHGDKVVLKLVGPATLKGFCRIEYDENMIGEQKWRLQVNEDGKVKVTYPFNAPKSQIATYSEKATLVPSRAETFFVEIPAGEHLYEFSLPENHRTVLLRFLLPQNELGGQ
jgi:hypothetical protein